MNYAVRNCNYVTTVLQHINCVSAYLNTHMKVGAKLVQQQCVDFSHDRIVTLEEEFATRWHSKLNVLERYKAVRPYLARGLPVDAPPVLDLPVDDAVGECIEVFREVRRVACALEDARRVSAARAPRLLPELCSTLRIMGARRDEPAAVLAQVETPRKSSARDDAALLSTSARASATRTRERLQGI